MSHMKSWELVIHIFPWIMVWKKEIIIIPQCIGEWGVTFNLIAECVCVWGGLFLNVIVVPICPTTRLWVVQLP